MLDAPLLTAPPAPAAAAAIMDEDEDPMLRDLLEGPGAPREAKKAGGEPGEGVGLPESAPMNMGLVVLNSPYVWVRERQKNKSIREAGLGWGSTYSRVLCSEAAHLKGFSTTEINTITTSPNETDFDIKLTN